MVGEEGESGVVEGAGHVFEEGVDEYEGYVAGERRGRVGLLFHFFSTSTINSIGSTWSMFDSRMWRYRGIYNNLMERGFQITF